MTPAGKRRAPCYGRAMRRTYSLIVALSALALGACAGDKGSYPSLARRPAERWSATSPVVTPAPVETPTPPPPELVDRLDRLVAQARGADALFREHTPHTRALIAAAADAAVASENWSVATVALSDLESQRSQAMIALADLDALYAAEGIKQADTTAIAKARDAVIAMVAEEDGVLGALKDGLKS
ncbi:MAG: hypothetical protein KGM49_03680 [Sphingomonadales bacterium]|nr:hypothetical protein [Sphingomonadales bacterium]